MDGEVGFIVAPRGRLLAAFRFGIAAGRIDHIDVVSDPTRLRTLDLAVLDD
ncbi:MAG: hypothetical protein WCA46_20530 [Actinocatenispora sp.]